MALTKEKKLLLISLLCINIIVGILLVSYAAGGMFPEKVGSGYIVKSHGNVYSITKIGYYFFWVYAYLALAALIIGGINSIKYVRMLTKNNIINDFYTFGKNFDDLRKINNYIKKEGDIYHMLFFLIPLQFLLFVLINLAYIFVNTFR